MTTQTKPVQLKPVPLGLAPSFGFGDRLGSATPGHLEAITHHGGWHHHAGGIRPIFAQQSIREMTRTKRNPTLVMNAAIEALTAEHFTGTWGADADHLKNEADVDYTAASGFVFFTIDPSEHVDAKADTYDAATVSAKFDAIKAAAPWVGQYLGKTVVVPDGPTIHFDELVVKRAAVKYGRAIAHTIKIAAHIDKVMKARGSDYEIELSVDETPEPTTLAEHFIIAQQCLAVKMKLVSLAPRFIGDLEKGVDYKGNLTALEISLNDHAAIARHLGPYKLSLHSGSDKLSMYGLFARATKGMFHVKTAGTSYLEALRVVNRHKPELFRTIVDFARERYDTDKATYHVSATVAEVPEPAEHHSYEDLERHYLGMWEDVPEGRGFTNPGRQILHCTFGSVLTDPTLGPAVTEVLHANPKTHREVLAEHFAMHLNALRSGM
ncbi:MAG: tagaturonate epimerase family protein [Planctomycetes bacterium]|nr:tagaturonate epimerase family protein [Planctomycetota bacterium]